MTSTSSDVELLRVVAHVALTHLDRLVAEGLDGAAIDNVTVHALGLTAPTGEHDDPAHRCCEAVGLRELLAVSSGPMSATLVSWLDDALGAAS